MARPTGRGDDLPPVLPIITVGPSLGSLPDHLPVQSASSPAQPQNNRGLAPSPNSECDENPHTAISPLLPATGEPASSPNSLFLQIPGVRSRSTSLESSTSFHDGESSTLITSPLSLRRSSASSTGTAVGHASSEYLPSQGVGRGMAFSDDTVFAFSPDTLAEMVSSKSVAEFLILGGLDRLAQGLRTDCAAGLSADECLLQTTSPQHITPRSPPIAQTDVAPAGSRVAIFGLNRLPQRTSRSLLQLMWLAFNDKILILLSVVATISLSVGLYQSLAQPHAPGQPRVEWVEGVTIMLAVAIVIAAGALNDWQKEQQFARLNNKKNDRMVKAIRSGKSVEISIHDILAGDVLHVEPGDVIPADGVLISCHNIRADESSVTGEADQIKKTGGEEVMKRAQHDPAPDRLDPFLISGSKILEGIGTYLVTAVGPHSMHGKLRMALSERTDPTPLQTKLSDVAEKIARAGVAIAILLFIILTIQFLRHIPGSLNNPFDHLQTLLRIFIVSLTVVVIAVPEGLPLAVTLALAIAVTRMLRDNNLVRVLSACETMGNATTVCCDKTGTLTMNKMTVMAGTVGLAHRFAHLSSWIDGDATNPSSDDSGSSLGVEFSEGVNETTIGKFGSAVSQEVRSVLIQSIAINSTAFEGEEDGEPTFIGSKTESALLSFARERLHMAPLNEERASSVVVEVYPFNSNRKSMASITRTANGTYRMYVKGAPELLLERSGHVLADASRPIKQVELTKERRQFLVQSVSSYTTHSLRTLSLAYRDFDHWPPLGVGASLEGNSLEGIINDLTFLAVLAIQDPLRPGVTDAVAACQHAGVCVRMVTGDNIATAKAIATECGILTESGVVMEGPQFRKLTRLELDRVVPRLQVLARSSPEDKATLVKELKDLGETVAATGDGTNDGPALRAADVGFSMGLSGTEVAKEASDIVLLDDNFWSLVKAVEWGRSVNDVIKKFLQFQLTVNVTAVTLTVVSAITNDEEESILTPVQLLWINLIMDTFAALALATDPPDPSVLNRQPDKRSAPLISLGGWKMIIGQSIYQLVVTLTLNFAGNNILNYTTLEEQKTLETLVFNSFVWMQFFNLYNNRRLDNKLNVFEDVFRNWYFISINLVIVIGQVLIIFFGGSALSATRLSAMQWTISLSLGVLSLLVAMLIRLIPDNAIHTISTIMVGTQLSACTPSRDDGFIWNDGIELVRSKLRDRSPPRNSLIEFLWRNIADARYFFVFRKAAPVEGDDEETRPLLRWDTSPTINGQSHDSGLIYPAAVMAGIVAGSVGGWCPSQSGRI